MLQVKVNLTKGSGILLLVLWQLIFYPFFSDAQGIYEVKYKFNQSPIEYTALIFYYAENPNNNIMRIRYYNNNGWNIAEQKISPLFFKSKVSGKDLWELTGSASSIISGPEKGLTYLPDNIFLVKKGESDYYEPYFVSSRNPTDTHIGTILSFKVLSKEDVTNSYLTNFNWKWHNENSEKKFSGTLHVILASNTNDVSLGTGFQANHKKLSALFRDIRKVCQLNLDLIEVTGDNFTKANLKRTINNLSVNANDVIFFYYSGHGFNDRSNNWPNLDMRQSLADDLSSNSLSLNNDIYNNLTGKNARLTIVIGECCNKYVENPLLTGTPVKEDPIMMAPSQNMLTAATFHNLLSKSGQLLVRTSDINEASYYTLNAGGDFCNNFISSLLSETGFTNTNGQVNWINIINASTSATLADSPKSSKPQHVRYYNAIKEN